MASLRLPFVGITLDFDEKLASCCPAGPIRKQNLHPERLRQDLPSIAPRALIVETTQSFFRSGMHTAALGMLDENTIVLRHHVVSGILVLMYVEVYPLLDIHTCVVPLKQLGFACCGIVRFGEHMT